VATVSGVVVCTLLAGEALGRAQHGQVHDLRFLTRLANCTTGTRSRSRSAGPNTGRCCRISPTPSAKNNAGRTRKSRAWVPGGEVELWRDGAGVVAHRRRLGARPGRGQLRKLGQGGSVAGAWWRSCGRFHGNGAVDKEAHCWDVGRGGDIGRTQRGCGRG
jgi:hypothetical protein